MGRMGRDIWGEWGVSEREKKTDLKVIYGQNGSCDIWGKWGVSEREKQQI